MTENEGAKPAGAKATNDEAAYKKRSSRTVQRSTASNTGS